jgi:hypothetical protein
MAAAPIRKRIVVIEDAMIASMARDSRFLNAFPFLKRIQAAIEVRAGKRCGGCGAKNRTRATAFHQVKTTIATLPVEKRNQLKELLNTDSIQIFQKDPKTNKITPILL